jgi:hypothetical protein
MAIDTRPSGEKIVMPAWLARLARQVILTPGASTRFCGLAVLSSMLRQSSGPLVEGSQW